jgi:hypothetical protein
MPRYNPLVVRAILFFLAYLIYAFTLSKILTFYSMIASIAYFMLIYGITIRKIHRQWHARVMKAAMIIDLTLVLTLEVKRHAVEKALEFSMPMLQQLHIGFSTLALVMYLPTYLLGRKLLLPNADIKNLRPLHIKVAWVTFFFRSLGFILMFSILLGRKS